MQNFVRFYIIESVLAQEFGKNGIAAPPTELYVQKLIIAIFNDVYFVSKLLYNFIN